MRKNKLEIKLNINALLLEVVNCHQPGSSRIDGKMIFGMTPIMRTRAPTDFLLIASMMRRLKTFILKFLQ